MKDLSNYKHQKRKFNPFEKNPNAGFRTKTRITKSRQNFVNKLDEKGKPKYKVGDIVYPMWGQWAHEKCEVVEIKNLEEHYLYAVISNIKKSETLNVYSELEYVLASVKHEIKSKKFRVGDEVMRSVFLRRYWDKRTVKEIFSYEHSEYVYCKLDNDSIYFIEDLVPYVEPKRVYSEVDPYGEEEWS